MSRLSSLTSIGVLVGTFVLAAAHTPAAGTGASSSAGAQAVPRKQPVALRTGGLADDQLQAVVDAVAKGERVEPARAIVVGGRVRVEVEGRSGREVAAAVRAHGGKVIGPRVHGLLLADVPADRALALERDPAVDQVHLPRSMSAPAESASLEASTALVSALLGAKGQEPVSKTNAAAWHTAGFNGAGVKVGIIDHFNLPTWTAAQAAGELPAPPASIFCRDRGNDCAASAWSSGIPHGQAVAETILDMAPAATIYLATAQTATDLQAVVDYFKSQGVRIITRSETAQYEGPGNGTGPAATIVANAVNSGIAWFNSAGNSAHSYWRQTGWVDNNADNFMDFPGAKYAANEVLEFDCAYMNGLRWSDWGPLRTDYDLYLYDNPADVSPYRVYAQTQSASVAPLEIPDMTDYSCAQGDLDYLSIYRKPGTAPSDGDVLEFMTNGASVEHGQAAYSATAPVVDAGTPGFLAVGAVDPWNGTTIASYSSQGPSNDGRIKPDISAASNFSSASYPQGFNGTSAATPVAAGAAALVLGANPAFSPAQLTTAIASDVADRGAAGPDNAYGTGELVLPAPPAPVTPPPPPPPPATQVAVTVADAFPIARTLKSSIPVQVRWLTSGTQSSATIWRSLNRGKYQQGAAVGTQHKVRLKMVLDKTNRFAVRAVDPAGNLSDWTYTREFRPRVIDDKDGKVHYAGGWRHFRQRGAWKGTLSGSQGTQGSARLSFKGSAVSVAAFRSANSGKVRVYVDGKPKAKLTLHANRVQGRRIVFTYYFPKRGKHTVELQPLTSGPRGQVFLDGFLVIG